MASDIVIGLTAQISYQEISTIDMDTTAVSKVVTTTTLRDR